jgi:glycosyltransferase involved in cell wall biosynthesis
LNEEGKIQVLLAGPYPRPDGMKGTHGRIIDNLRTSVVLKDDVRFTQHRVTLPADGSLPSRFLVDMIRSVRSLKQKPDILHLIMQKFRSVYREHPMLTMARLRGVKTVVDIRAGSLQRMFQRKDYPLQNALMGSIFRKCDSIVLECRKDMEFVRDRFGREGIHIPNAVLTEDFERVSPTPHTLSMDRPIRLIHSGRYAEAKGTTVLLESMKILSQRGLRAELHLTGAGEEPEVLNKIDAFVKSPPDGTLVVEHGWAVPDLLELLASGHVLVLVTEHLGEGHPNSINEAMTAGLGLILSDWLHREDIVPEAGAIIVPPRDPVALADAVQQYIDNPDLLAEARRVNRRCVEERYLDRVCYPRFLQLYTQLRARDTSS